MYHKILLDSEDCMRIEKALDQYMADNAEHKRHTERYRETLRRFRQQHNDQANK